MNKKLHITVFTLLFSILLAMAGCARSEAPPAFKEGDILFQITQGPQSTAIQMGTGSKYTHCGILLKKNGRLQVFEAGRKVKWTPIDTWINRGMKNHYVLMRLKDSSLLTDRKLQAMRADTAYFEGKDYDLLFQWSDTKIYCSELVWKLYKKATGLELGKIRTFADYDLNHKAVQKIIKERYGQELKLDEKVVAPSDIMDSDLLVVVSKNQVP